MAKIADPTCRMYSFKASEASRRDWIGMKWDRGSFWTGQVVLAGESWMITEGSDALTLHLGGEFRLDSDLERLVGTLEPVVQHRDEVRCVLVDASAMPKVPPALIYTVRVLDRHARAFNTTIDFQPAA